MNSALPADRQGDVLQHLTALVACDTQNPPRRIGPQDRLFTYLADALDGFERELVDEGDGCVSLLAVRGRPRRLVNVHLDTVPASALWRRDPLSLHVEGGRAYGLGACDIKGGAAALLDAARALPTDAALLFTTDEELGESLCVRRFLRAGRPLLGDLELVVVVEPTEMRAVLAHRGYARAEAHLQGVPGHSSEPRGLVDNANHRLAHWLVSALAEAERRESEGALGLTGLRFNCGVIEGGTADNVIAGSARAVFSLRPGPDVDPLETARFLGSLEGAKAEVPFVGPPLPAGRDATRRADAARAFAEGLGLAVSPPVGFWTEAALFSEAGFTTFVCGPGAIAQAHTADEWVAVPELLRARAFFASLFSVDEAPARQADGDEQVR